jgi:hypothetical protein
VSSSTKTAKRKIADVQIGDVYEVRVAGRACAVEIVRREDSGVWMGRKVQSGRYVCITLSDLGVQLPAVLPGVVVDYQRLAAGDKEDIAE